MRPWPLILLPDSAPLHAHQIAEMSMILAVTGEEVSAVIAADAAYLLPELRGDEDEEPKDLAWRREQGPGEWERIEAEAIADDRRGDRNHPATGSPQGWSAANGRPLRTGRTPLRRCAPPRRRSAAGSSPFSRPPVRPNGCFRSFPPKANSLAASRALRG